MIFLYFWTSTLWLTFVRLCHRLNVNIFFCIFRFLILSFAIEKLKLANRPMNMNNDKNVFVSLNFSEIFRIVLAFGQQTQMVTRSLSPSCCVAIISRVANGDLSKAAYVSHSVYRYYIWYFDFFCLAIFDPSADIKRCGQRKPEVFECEV